MAHCPDRPLCSHTATTALIPFKPFVWWECGFKAQVLGKSCSILIFKNKGASAFPWVFGGTWLWA